MGTHRINKSYSSLSAWTALFFSFYGWFNLYIKGYSPILWIIDGLSLIITILVLTLGLNDLNKFLRFPHLPFSVFNLVCTFVPICYFCSAIYGLITFINQLQLKDVNLSLFPVTICTFLFAGASIGLFQRD